MIFLEIKFNQGEIVVESTQEKSILLITLSLESLYLFSVKTLRSLKQFKAVEEVFGFPEKLSSTKLLETLKKSAEKTLVSSRLRFFVK